MESRNCCGTKTNIFRSKWPGQGAQQWHFCNVCSIGQESWLRAVHLDSLHLQALKIMFFCPKHNNKMSSIEVLGFECCCVHLFMPWLIKPDLRWENWGSTRRSSAALTINREHCGRNCAWKAQNFWTKLKKRTNQRTEQCVGKSYVISKQSCWPNTKFHSMEDWKGRGGCPILSWQHPLPHPKPSCQPIWRSQAAGKPFPVDGLSSESCDDGRVVFDHLPGGEDDGGVVFGGDDHLWSAAFQTVRTISRSPRRSR